MEAIYNFDIGDEFEIACCNLIQSLLPPKFGICRGHIITLGGEEAGDDIIIFDQANNPTLRLFPKGDFSRKEFIPAESVYAYIEVKHKLILNGRNENFSKALEQVALVKSLSRKNREHSEILHGFTLGVPISVDPILDSKYSNPWYGVVLSRFLEQENDFKDYLRREYKNNKHLSPDLVIAGNEYIGLPMQYNSSENRGDFRIFRHTGDLFALRYTPEDALAIGLLTLLNAIQSIDLKLINWRPVILNVLNKNIK